MTNVGKLIACGILSILLLSFLVKIYFNIFHPEFVIASLDYSPIYSSGAPSTSLMISTIGNIFFSLVAIVSIIAIWTSD